MKLAIGAALAACALLWAGSASAIVVDYPSPTTPITLNGTLVAAEDGLAGFGAAPSLWVGGGSYEFEFTSTATLLSGRFNVNVNEQNDWFNLDGTPTFDGGDYEAWPYQINLATLAPAVPLTGTSWFQVTENGFKGRFDVPLNNRIDELDRYRIERFNANFYFPPLARFAMGGAGENWTFTLSPVAAVPEPTTWAMMIVGFGLVGATVRTRRFGSSSRQHAH